uniref:Ig-like domain-containing protein n=1 Tax=Mesocestoides corti TaxID=53468 RepID=A0A5K3EN35_MESCO
MSKCELIVDEVNERYVLLINKLRVKDDAGEYMIRAENELGITVCKTILNLECTGPSSSLRFIQPLPERTVVQPGSPVTLGCEVAADESVNFQWYLNGIEIPRTAPDFVIDDSEPMRCSFTIPEVKSEMVPGKIHVQATTSNGASVNSTSILETQVTPQDYVPSTTVPLQFVQPLQPNVMPHVGEDVVLITAVESVPHAEITWVVDNPETAKRCEIAPLIDQYHPTRTISQITIHEFNPLIDDNVTIRAIAKNLDKEITTSCELHATQEKDKPEKFIAHFTRNLEPLVEVREAHKVVLECAVQPTEAPLDFKWYFNGIEVSSKLFSEIVIEKRRFQSTLTIERAETKCTGTVNVEVVYPQGEKLLSTCKLYVIPQSSATEATKTPEVIVPVPLRLVQPLQPTMQSAAGEDVVLVVAVEAIPQAEITWTVSHPQTASRSEIVSLVDNTHPTFTISQLTIRDFNPLTDAAVTVQATAKTPDKEVVTTCELQEKKPDVCDGSPKEHPGPKTIIDKKIDETKIPEEEMVEERPVLETPSVQICELKFTKPLQPALTPNEERILDLECEIQADLKPITVKWTHNGRELQSSERYEEVYVEEQGLARLTIREFSPKDVGQYSCVVSGEVIEPETGMLRSAKTISTTTVAEITEELPVVEEAQPTEVV